MGGPEVPRLAPNGERIKDGLKYILGWAERDVSIVRNMLGNAGMRLLKKNFRDMSYSSACSGIDSPGMSSLPRKFLASLA